MSVDVDRVVTLYDVLLRLSSLADKYNELINVYKDLLTKEVEIKVPQLGNIFIEPRKFKEFIPLPAPTCIETDKEFNTIYFGKRICIRWTDTYTQDIRCYSNKMTITDLAELSCNISDILEKTVSDLEQYVDTLPRVIEKLKTIIAESKLLS
jgi:hypothetical protein